jgi:MoxR-like ATPase
VNSDQGIFIFTAGDQAARAHLFDSIENPLDLQRVIDHFEVRDHAAIKGINEKHGLYAWGAVPGERNNPTWELIKIGDWMLCVYESTYHFVAQVAAKYENKSFAKDVWGETEEGNTWELMYFLTKPIRVSLNIADLNDLLNKRYMGFTRISDEKLQAINQIFGSTQVFIESRLINESSALKAGANPLDKITRDDVIDALALIDSGQMHGFSSSVDYDLVYEDRRYPPKAAAGIATRRTLGRPMRPDEFSSGLGSRNFRVLESLGFEIALKEQAEQYFLVRSNPESPYHDEVGKLYHFNSNVPNHKRLQNGGMVVVDSKTTIGLRVLGYGRLAPAQTKELESGIRDLTSEFVEWIEFNPIRELTNADQLLIQAQPGYNIQHAIKPITHELFKVLIGKSFAIESKKRNKNLCLLGSGSYKESELVEANELIKKNECYASWWSFPIRDEVAELLETPFHIYINSGGGVFKRRLIIEDFSTSHGNIGLESPWPDITPESLKGKRRDGERNSEIFKTWFKVSAIEEIKPPLTLKDFEPMEPWSNTTNLLNPAAFGYAHRITEPYSMNDALNDLLISENEFKEMLESIREKKNLILQGPPGTGKSFVAKRLAYALVGSKDDRFIQSVQFHQSFSYEDFIQGFRPKKDSSSFTLKDGVFFRFCNEAILNPGRPYVFIIDEINRGNLSKIFGEVMLLIEADKRGEDWAVSLTYSDENSKKFYIPPNVHILGMMNTADRSLAIVDYALRRRFAFKDVLPGFDSDKFRPLLESRGVESQVISAIQSKMAALNKEIESSVDLGRGFTIGHSFFVPFQKISDSNIWYERVIKNEIVPLLREYWFDKKQSEIDQHVQSLSL